MKKSIEDAADIYAENQDRSPYYHSMSVTQGVIDSFIAGDAHGYARALDESSEGHCEWHTKTFIEKSIDVGYGYGLDAWRAAKLSSQKELAVKDAKIKELEANVWTKEDALKADDFIFKLEEKIKSIDCYVRRDEIIKELEEKLKVADNYLSGISCTPYEHPCDEADEALAKIRGEK